MINMNLNAVTLAIIGFALTLISCDKNQEVVSKPNIILIIVDDLGYADISCAGLAPEVSTPNIDRLAKKGIRFTNAYATSPICNASRAAIITGCYQQRFGTYWYQSSGIERPDIATLPEILKKQGYSSGYVGKVHYGTNDRNFEKRSFP